MPREKSTRVRRTFTPDFKRDADRVRQLEKELRDTREERDILRKALAYFADDQK